MRLRFLGGVDEVGRLALHVETGGAHVLLDYGMAPWDPPEYPLEAPPVDAAFLSHGHLDHAGMLPSLADLQDVPIYATNVSQDLAVLLARDSLKIARQEGYPKPFHGGAIEAMARSFETVHPGSQVPVGLGGNVDVRVHPAGHIPGSTMLEVDDGDRSLVFTGDVNVEGTRLVSGAEPVPCDVLVTEATYAGRVHPDRDAEERRFLEAVEETLDHGGTAMVPAFATGRTQEMLMILVEAGYRPWVDGMGRRVLDIFRSAPEHLRDPAAYQRAMDAARPVRHRNDRQRATDGGEVVVTTSGMVEGGPILHYLQVLGGDASSRVLLTGYQVEGTGGRRLLDEGLVELDGGLRRIACPVERFHFSSHADHPHLVELIGGCDPETLILCHSENREDLAAAFPDLDVRMPRRGELIEV